MAEEPVAPVEQDPLYKAAKKRVEDVKGFYVHLMIYLVVNVILFTINMLTDPHSLWFYWVLLGWGIAIVIHFLTVFVFEGRFLGADWEKRKIDEYMKEHHA